MGQLFTGTSGWSNREWKPEFYPASLKSGEWLAYYARHLPSVEINNSFYRLPDLKLVARWREQVPPSFGFAVKAWRRITHELKLKRCAAEIAQFGEVLRAFGEQLGPVLFQLPPSLHADLALLDDFLGQLPGGYGYAFEFRHASWFDDALYDLLARHNIALCQTHLRHWDRPLMGSGPFNYIRLHGAEKLYLGSYDEDFLRRLAEWIKAQERKASYVYFNNTMGSPVAVRNAERLLQLCSEA